MTREHEGPSANQSVKLNEANSKEGPKARPMEWHTRWAPNGTKGGKIPLEYKDKLKITSDQWLQGHLFTKWHFLQ